MRDSTFWVFVIPVLNVLSMVFALSYAVRNKGEVFPLPSLPSPSSLRDATSPKARGLGSLPKIAGHLVLRQTFTAFSRDFTGKEL